MVRMVKGRLRPSPALLVAFVALVVALGGTSYAVTQLPARSVGAKQLKKGAVARVHIKGNAVNGAKVAKESLTGADINEATLGQVPSAAAAGSANAAARANTTGALDRISYRTVTRTVAAGTADVHAVGVASVPCDAGQLVAGGGAKVDDPAAQTSVIDSYPDAGGRSWTAHVDNSDTIERSFTVYAVCIAALAAG